MELKFHEKSMTVMPCSSINNVGAFRKEMKLRGMMITPQANDILIPKSFVIANCEKELEGVVISVAELGFENDAKLKDIHNAADRKGFGLCQPEFALHLRLQCTNQAKGEIIFVAMEPVPDLYGNPKMFGVWYDGLKYNLDANSGHPDSMWSGEELFIFLRR